MMNITLKKENKIIKGGIIIFWGLFWLLNVVDKIIPKDMFLWMGKDRLAQFVNYFESIGIANPIIAQITLFGVSVLQVLALIFFIIAVVQYLKGNMVKARAGTFWGILFSLIIFSLFAIGDQIFGDRFELMEHTIYWIALVNSWFVYTHVDKK